MSVEPTRKRIEALIAAEDEQLSRVVSFIEQGMLARRISGENGDALIAAAEARHDANVRLLRQLLGEEQ
jgi:hypothetical protein